MSMHEFDGLFGGQSNWTPAVSLLFAPFLALSRSLLICPSDGRDQPEIGFDKANEKRGAEKSLLVRNETVNETRVSFVVFFRFFSFCIR